MEHSKTNPKIEDKVEAHVYVITHLPTKRHYVGKSVCPAVRWRSHISDRSSYISRAIQKYGKKEFTFQVVESFASESEAYLEERWWIEFLRSNHPGEGFNLHPGGMGASRARILWKKNKWRNSKPMRKLLDAIFGKLPDAS